MQGGPAGGRGLLGGCGVGADRGGAEAMDGDPRKRTDAHPCKKDGIASVTENQREERKTGVCLNDAWETIPSRCTPALSGERERKIREREWKRGRQEEVNAYDI